MVEKISGEIGRRGFLLLGISVTPLHPGSGKSLGAVDLTIQRDPLGYPVVFASSVKGALKSLCIRRKTDKIDSCVDDRGLAKCGGETCSGLNVCCCLFGSEAGGEESQQALVSILDFTLLAMPVPSADEGYVYVTSQALLRKASLIIEALGEKNLAESLKDIASSLASTNGSSQYTAATAEPIAKRGRLDIAGSIISVKQISSSSLERIRDLAQKLSGLAETLPNKLVVLSDEVAPVVIERGLLRVTRVRIRRDRKTVAEGSLWTEEYIPSGAVFVSGLLITPAKNSFCDKVDVKLDEKSSDMLKTVSEKIKEIIGGDTFYFTVGGKETVGKGLVKVYVHGLGSGKL